jgi:hypothetical protein
MSSLLVKTVNQDKVLQAARHDMSAVVAEKTTYFSCDIARELIGTLQCFTRQQGILNTRGSA